jgi:DNA-binding HxlR family transcriptional regulator
VTAQTSTEASTEASAEASVTSSTRTYTCGLDAAVDVVGGKWKPLILWALDVAPRRYGELRREVEGISEKVLISQLRDLQRDGLVRRTVYEQVPPKVVYSLTAMGESLNAALEPLGDWGEAHMTHIVATRSRT